MDECITDLGLGGLNWTSASQIWTQEAAAGRVHHRLGPRWPQLEACITDLGLGGSNRKAWPKLGGSITYLDLGAQNWRALCLGDPNSTSVSHMFPQDSTTANKNANDEYAYLSRRVMRQFHQNAIEQRPCQFHQNVTKPT